MVTPGTLPTPGTIVAVVDAYGLPTGGAVTVDTDRDALVIRTAHRGTVTLPWSDVAELATVGAMPQPWAAFAEFRTVDGAP
jgi:hypothetical protein